MKWSLLTCSFLVTINTFSQDINKEKLDQYIDYVNHTNAGVGSISIFKNGIEEYNRSFGQQYIDNMQHNADSKYQVASVTKLITAILVFKLIEADKLRLDTRLDDFFPEIPNANKITIKHLLEHSSGLGNFAIKNGNIWILKEVSDKDIVAEIKRQGVTFEPSERVLYSNSAYVLLRMILENKHKKEYRKIIDQEIVEPLNLKNFSSAKSNPNNVYRSYIFDGNWKEIDDIVLTNVVGVGDITSTTKDLNTIITNLFQFKIIKPETLALMMPTLDKENWGRGIAVFPYGEQTFLGHSGDILGSHARLIYNPKDKIAISYATNGERIPTNKFIEVVVSIIYNQPFEYPTIN